MRTPFTAGNWKMNKTPVEAAALAQALLPGLTDVNGAELALCPPFVCLPAVAKVLEGTKIGLGAQNMHWKDAGAFTGEVSPLMLKGWCQYVILGHSERRQYFGETDAGVNQKVKAALTHGLTPIICVGEKLEENQAGQTGVVVTQQVRGAYADIPAAEAQRTIIAYEPVWAIGTGLAATPEGANAVIRQYIRAVLAEMYSPSVAEMVRVLYGGSVTAANAADLMAQPEIDGGLVGGASLKVDEFIAIARATAK